MFWWRSWSWSVFALFLTSAFADDVAVCVALLGPPEMSFPASELGAFELTAFWWLLAMPSAPCFVSAPWIPSWNPPAPPQPTRQLPFRLSLLASGMPPELLLLPLPLSFGLPLLASVPSVPLRCALLPSVPVVRLLPSG